MVTSCAVMTTRKCNMVRMMQFRRDRIDGTLVGTAESNLRRSRGWIPYLRQSSSFGTCATMDETLPRASRVVHRTSSPEPAAPPETAVPLEDRRVLSSAFAVSRFRSRVLRSCSRSTDPPLLRLAAPAAECPAPRIGARRRKEAKIPGLWCAGLASAGVVASPIEDCSLTLWASAWIVLEGGDGVGAEGVEVAGGPRKRSRTESRDLLTLPSVRDGQVVEIGLVCRCTTKACLLACCAACCVACCECSRDVEARSDEAKERQAPRSMS